MNRFINPANASAILLHAWRRALCGLSLALIPVTSALAMSYVPMADEALLASSDVVVRGTIVEVRGAAGRELDETSYRLQQDEVLKGTVGPGDLDIRLPGAFDQTADGALIIPGMPRLAADEPVLLFLNQHADGSYSPNQLLLGIFRIGKDVAGKSILIQDLEQAEVISSPGQSPASGRFRNAERFVDWVRARAQGKPDDESYWSDADAAPDRKYQLTNPKVRWFQFQDNLSVSIYANESSATSSDVGHLQTAINAWNAAPGSAVSLVYSGISTKSSGLDVADGVTQVLFNDPNNELLGVFDCLIGGIGAYGKWRAYSSRSFNGETYGIISEGDIVVQDGISCLFSGDRSINSAELLAHEIGHILGLKHSCGEGLLSFCTAGTAENEALMRPTLHADGRGASLGTDDIAGIAKLYPPISGNDGSGNRDTITETEPSSGGGAVDLTGLGLLLLALFGALSRSACIDRSVKNQNPGRAARSSRIAPDVMPALRGCRRIGAETAHLISKTVGRTVQIVPTNAHQPATH